MIAAVFLIIIRQDDDSAWRIIHTVMPAVMNMGQEYGDSRAEESGMSIMKPKKSLTFIMFFLLLTAMLSPGYAERNGPAVMRDITTMELVREMGIGINLGNTFESFGDWIRQYFWITVQTDLGPGYPSEMISHNP